MAASFHILKEGHACSLFERESVLGGTLHSAIADGKMTQEVLDSEIRILQQLGLEINLNTPLSIESFENIRKEYDAVIIATGSISDEISNLMFLLVEACFDYKKWQ